MTRPKVDPLLRIRIQNACNQCKRRKSKCDGHDPCSRCAKGSDPCCYTPQASAEPPLKKRCVEEKHPERRMTVSSVSSSRWSPITPSTLRSPPDVNILPKQTPTAVVRRELPSMLTAPFEEVDEEHQSTFATRMLWAGPRIVWLGPSAILTSLNFVRSCAMDLVGPTKFTHDENSGKMLEQADGAEDLSDAPSPVEGLLLSIGTKSVARHLIAVYKHNIQPMFDLVPLADLDRDVDVAWHDNDDDYRLLDAPRQCRLYLVLGLGLVLDKNSHSDEYALAGTLYHAAVRLQNTSEPSTEDLVRIWALRSVYAMTVSRRNVAWDHVRTAVGLAIGAGMHVPRQTRHIIVSLNSNSDQHPARALGPFAERCALWKSLFVLDAYLSALVGRPPAADADCTEPGWDYMTDTERAIMLPPAQAANLSHAVGASRTIAMALKALYNQHSALLKTRSVRDIADDARPRDGPTASILLEMHRHHATIVLTNPCLLWMVQWRCQQLPTRAELDDDALMAAWIARQKGLRSSLSSLSPASDDGLRIRSGPRAMMKRISAACLRASCLTMELLRQAFVERESFSPRNPVVISFSFAAILVIMGNEIASLYHNPDYLSHARLAINVLEYCAGVDPQARRLLYIVENFHCDIMARKDAVTSLGGGGALHLVHPIDQIPIAAPLECIPPVGAYERHHHVDYTAFANLKPFEITPPQQVRDGPSPEGQSYYSHSSSGDAEFELSAGAYYEMVSSHLQTI